MLQKPLVFTARISGDCNQGCGVGGKISDSDPWCPKLVTGLCMTGVGKHFLRRAA